MRRTIIHTVDLQYQCQELLALFALAVKEDVDKGGRYDARSNAINIWSYPWTPEGLRHESTIMGTFHCAWEGGNRIFQVETDLGFTLDDLRRELGELEIRALSRLKHGSQPTIPCPTMTRKHFYC